MIVLPYRILGLCLVFLLGTSCGPTPQAGGGIGGTGSVATVASGPVTKFGSVFVSGTEYDNTSALYCIDDDPCSTENRLKLGMIVVVNGTVTRENSSDQPITRTANTITFEESVEGVVQSIAADGLSLVVLGQVVHIDQDTVIDPSIGGQAIENLQQGTDVVEVSGFVVGDGHILATFIMKQDGIPHYEVQGTIKNHDTRSQTFEIGSLFVDYSSADISQMPPVSSLWNGLVIHARGNDWSQQGTSSVGARLTATRVTLQTLGVEDIGEADVEGFITQVVAPGDFFVNNLRVSTGAVTTFEGGTVNDLAVGVHLDMHGPISGGTLQAEHVAFEGEIEFESNVASIDVGTGALKFIGFSDVAVLIDSETAIDGEGDLRRLEDIRIGDHLKVHARQAGTSEWVATELERSAPSMNVTLEGPVQSSSDPLLVVGGVTIDTSDISDNRFFDKDGTVMGRSVFFRDLAMGMEVSVKGSLAGNIITWGSARIE